MLNQLLLQDPQGKKLIPQPALVSLLGNYPLKKKLERVIKDLIHQHILQMRKLKPSDQRQADDWRESEGLAPACPDAQTHAPLTKAAFTVCSADPLILRPW